MQPWATLVVIGAKKIETRSWDTRYMGEVLIHASLGRYYGAGKDKISCREICYKKHFIDYIGGGLGFDKLPFGAIIGKVNLYDTMQFGSGKAIEIIQQYDAKEIAFGDYSEGRYGWLLSDPIQFKKPIPAKGQLNIWNYELENLHQLT